MSTSIIGNKKGLSLGKVAVYCGVTRKTILRWVQDGLLKSFTLPSGHHRIMPDEVIRFLRDHNMPIPPEIGGKEAKFALVVDDELHIRRVICDLLKSHFQVEEATNGIEACISMGARTPDLLVLDNRMPGMDGLEVCRQMRRDPKLANTKIIIVSAHLNPELQASLQGFVDEIIPKPFSPTQLVRSALTLAGLRDENT